MDKDEVIIVKNITDNTYEKIVERAVRYSLISLPFTIDRMKIPDESKRALNIAKGKIAEELFKWFCVQNNIKVDFAICETPFWQTDKRDFVMNGYEWDIKNNFLYLQKKFFYDYTCLPALIPNRHPGDQWNTKNERKIPGSKGVRYLFTFMKGAGLYRNKRGKYFLEINLSKKQKEILRFLYSKYQGKPANSKPFHEKDFWEKFNAHNPKLFNLNYKPELVITGFAGDSIWHKFKDTGPYSKPNYIDFIKPYWYRKTGKNNSLSWCNGVLWTKITNKTIPIRYLPSFKEFTGFTGI